MKYTPKCFVFFTGLIVGIVIGGSAYYYKNGSSPKSICDTHPVVCEPNEKNYMYS